MSQINPDIIETITMEVAVELTYLEIALYMDTHSYVDYYEISEKLSIQRLKDHIKHIALGVQIDNLSPEIQSKVCASIKRHVDHGRINILINLNYGLIIDIMYQSLNDLAIQNH